MPLKKILAYGAVAVILLLLLTAAYEMKRGGKDSLARRFGDFQTERGSVSRRTIPAKDTLAYRPYDPEMYSSSGTIQHKYPNANVQTNRPVRQAAFKTTENLPTYSHDNPSFSTARSYQPVRGKTGTSYSHPYTASSGAAPAERYPYQRGTSAVSSSQPDEEKTPGARILDGFFSKQTRQEKRALDEKLNALFKGVDQAVYRAMMPKSQQATNGKNHIQEVNSQQKAAENASISSQSSATQQISAQAASIVNSVRNQYGNEAASQASQVMDDFRQEMNQVLNSQASPEEKMAQAHAVNNKYNEKLRNLNQKEAFAKFEKEQRAKNKKQVAEIGKAFNSKTAQAADDLLEQNLQKRIEIMRAGHDEKEAYRQVMELEEKQRQDLDNLAKQYNPTDLNAATKMQDLRNAQIQKEIEQEKEAVESGKKQAQYYQAGKEAVKEMDEAWKKENQKIVDSMAAYGPQAQAKAQQILDDMRSKRKKIVLEGGKLSDVNNLMKEDTARANKELEQIRRSYQEEWIKNTQQKLNAENDKILAQYTAQMQGASFQQKEAWKQQARPIMEKYNARRAQLMLQSKNQADVDAMLQRLAQEELQELQQIQVAAE